ncbi:hypothetical protein AcW1_007183 [Taiwanofungus camphoratus]|nr:hypothetical protein AcW1_007183 [Antrodia cinnamomea]
MYFLRSLALAVLANCAAAVQVLTGPSACLTAGAYTLCQNQWGASTGIGSQNSTYIDAYGSMISWMTDYTWAESPNNVKTYANVLQNSAKGMQLSAITSAPTSWQWAYLTETPGLRADVSYDIWTGVPSAGAPASNASSYEIMIWLSGQGGITPVGSQILANIPIAGYTWNLWRGPNANWEVLSFVSADGNINDFNADLKDFFDYLITSQSVASTQYLQAIQTGTEPFVGNATLFIASFSADVYT